MSDFDLKGKRIADTYKGLLKLAVSGNGAVSSSLTQVEGGDGTNTALFVATDSVKVGGAFAVSSSASVGGSLKVNGDVCASSYYGEGSNITGISGTNISGNISVSNISAAGNVNITGTLALSGTTLQAENARVCASAFYGEGSNLTGVKASIGTAPNISVSGFVSLPVSV